MTDLQNFFYALAQLIHNFGAVAVMGGAVYALSSPETISKRKIAWVVLIAWGLQGASGGAFGAISYYYYGKFPDISGAAMIALGIKIVSTAFGFILAAAQLFANLSKRTSRLAWIASSVLGVLALSSAAVLRWFS